MQDETTAWTGIKGHDETIVWIVTGVHGETTAEIGAERFATVTLVEDVDGIQ